VELLAFAGGAIELAGLLTAADPARAACGAGLLVSRFVPAALAGWAGRSGASGLVQLCGTHALEPRLSGFARPWAWRTGLEALLSSGGTLERCLWAGRQVGLKHSGLG